MARFRIIPCANCQSLNKIPAEKNVGIAKCGSCKSQLTISDFVFEVSDAALTHTISNCPIPVVVDFWAPWCAPCVSFAPTFKSYAAANPHLATFLKINTEANPSVSGTYNIRGIPTLIIFRDGKEIARQSGALSLNQLNQWLSQVLK